MYAKCQKVPSCTCNLWNCTISIFSIFNIYISINITCWTLSWMSSTCLLSLSMVKVTESIFCCNLSPRIVEASSPACWCWKYKRHWHVTWLYCIFLIYATVGTDVQCNLLWSVIQWKWKTFAYCFRLYNIFKICS